MPAGFMKLKENAKPHFVIWRIKERPATHCLDTESVFTTHSFLLLDLIVCKSVCTSNPDLPTYKLCAICCMCCRSTRSASKLTCPTGLKSTTTKVPRSVNTVGLCCGGSPSRGSNVRVRAGVLWFLWFYASYCKKVHLCLVGMGLNLHKSGISNVLQQIFKNDFLFSGVSFSPCSAQQEIICVRVFWFGQVVVYAEHTGGTTWHTLQKSSTCPLSCGEFSGKLFAIFRHESIWTLHRIWTRELAGWSV